MNESRFLAACRRQPVDATPVWFMRQAGRYMAEYRAIRKKYGLLEIVKQPELAVEVTLQPVRAFNVDAAILFADILLPLQPMDLKRRSRKGCLPLPPRSHYLTTGSALSPTAGPPTLNPAPFPASIVPLIPQDLRHPAMKIPRLNKQPHTPLCCGLSWHRV